MTDRSRLVPFIESIAGTRVLVIGDAMLDRFVNGSVERISPEAPIPVLRVAHESVMPGGAGNVVRNLSALGADVTFVAVIGDDAPGRELTNALESDPKVTTKLIVDADRPTTIKVRYVAGNQQILRADWESGTALGAPTGDAIVDAATKAVAACDCVVLSDYDKGVLGDGRAVAIIEAARKAGKPVIADPKSDDFGRYRGATLVTPNKKEMARAAGGPLGDDASIVSAAEVAISVHDLDGLLVTRSAEGMSLIDKEGDVCHLSAESREVFDVSGAGDTVVAVVAAMIGAGHSAIDAATVANVAAGIVVAKVGTAVARADEIVAALHHGDLSEAEAKVLGAEQAADRVGQWQRRGLKVGFTNGCFDLLHPGHVSLLKQARAACDRLVVAINSDASVKRLKGEERPVQNEAARSAIMASLGVVDAVVIFGEDTPRELIAALRPDVLVKGADYTVETVVGADLVQSWGGRVVLANLEDGFSTTATIARMNEGK